MGAVAVERAGADPDLWTLLSGAVERPGGSGDLPVVADSKRVFSGPEAFARLERTALAFLGMAGNGRIPSDVAALVEAGPGNSLPLLARHPWYRDLEHTLPRVVPRSKVEEDLSRLARRCAERGVRVRAAEVRVVPEIEFNRAVRAAGNKADVIFALAAQAVSRLAGLPRPGEATILVDRLGGRRFYAPGLASHLPEFLPTPIREGKRRSTYLLHGAARGARLEFAVGGEERSFACAIASILAKYARELLVEQLNAYYRARAPGLRPTAGYVLDGRRFLAELREALPEAEVPLDLLVRVR